MTMTTYMPAITTVYSGMDMDTDTIQSSRLMTSLPSPLPSPPLVKPTYYQPITTYADRWSTTAMPVDYTPCPPSPPYSLLDRESGSDDSEVDEEEEAEEEADTAGYAYHQPQYNNRRRLPIFVQLTEREARRRERVALGKALLAELGAHRCDIAAFKRRHTQRLAQLEHERVAPMEAAVAAVMLMTATNTTALESQQMSGRTARAAAAARQRARLSPTSLALNRSLSERAVSVLQAADRLEMRGEHLIYAARAILDRELGRSASRLVSRRYDSDDAASDCGSDMSTATSSLSASSASMGWSNHHHSGSEEEEADDQPIHQRVAQLDYLASAVERLRHVAADFMCAYPA